MAKNLISNAAKNGWQGLNNIGNNVHQSFKMEAPISHAIRNRAGRDDFNAYAKKHGTEKAMADFKYKEGTISKKRIGALAGGAYLGADMAYRTISGGSAYRNNTGEKDIVGIPLL